MSEPEVDQLKKEINELRQSVKILKETVNYLTEKLEEKQRTTQITTKYDVTTNFNSFIEDMSWARLLKFLHKEDYGLTARELAKRWGKSRSRTSEVLNRLVEEGLLVKYRDGREIRFRPTKKT